MDPTGALETILEIATRHGYDGQAALVGNWLEQVKTDKRAVWAAVNTNEVWGGSGSLADIVLRATSEISESQARADEFRWRHALINLNAGMRENGILNLRAQAWVDTFQIWNEAGIGI